MPDFFATITAAPPEILEGIIAVLEMRAADPQHQAMLRTYLTEAAIPQGAHVLEVGCGTGAVTRVLAAWPGVVEAVGVDPSPVLVAKARELGAGLPALSFKEADGRSLPFADRCLTSWCSTRPSVTSRNPKRCCASGAGAASGWMPGRVRRRLRHRHPGHKSR